MFVHATEDETRLLNALERLVPPDKITREELAGHFGNPIINFRATLNNEEAEVLFKKICIELEGDGEKLLNKKQGNKVYLRLDKAGLVNGKLTLDGDAGIHLEFRLK